MTTATVAFQPGSLVKARGREWVVLPESRDDVLRLRPLGGSDDDATVLYVPLEPVKPAPASFAPPDPAKSGSQSAALLLRDALRLKLRAGAGPFRSFGNIGVEPRAYQLVPLLMALRLDTVRLLIADDVGIGKTIEAGLIVRELIDRGEIERFAVICPPHLCEQWQRELASKFNLLSEVVRTGTASRLERGLPAGKSLFDEHHYTVVSLDYIKSNKRRDEFRRACPEFVIVEEAHTCVQAGGRGRHQRYELLRLLAADAERHMLFLTATPHSGDEQAFANLLGLLAPGYANLGLMPEGDARDRLRQDLARHFVQRRRGDIKDWGQSNLFPDRETAEATYRLTGDWGRLFDAVLGYARGIVERAGGQSKLQQRMTWWAALALLRCMSSSPAAASIALRTRLKGAEGLSEDEQIAELEAQGAETVFDGESDDVLNLDESVPAGTTEALAADPEDAETLRQLIDQADALKGPRKDPKLAVLIREVDKLLEAGFRPVVFCRYIATAGYLAEHLKEALKRRDVTVSVVTGELTPEQREDAIAGLEEVAEASVPVLVATDCLSEGINLQHLFTAVVHYDLAWNPTRHEQREGRVDRFRQPEPVVRALMLYGENNPVDGAVLRVILRKAEKIRRDLGVLVPMPADSNKLMETIMQAVLLRRGGVDETNAQLRLDLESTEREIDLGWESAKEKQRQSQTIFAQRRLRPDEVLPEWQKAVGVLGGAEDVERFVRTSTERLGAPMEKAKGQWRLPAGHLPAALKERLAAIGIEDDAMRLSFQPTAPAGVVHVHRSHPLVAALADYVAERALAEDTPDLAARAGAIFTDEVKERTTVYLLRLRSQLTVSTRKDGQFVPKRQLLSEECLGAAVRGSGTPQLLDEADALRLMEATPVRDMAAEQRERVVARSIEALPGLANALAGIAQRRADELLADHTRVREASRSKGIQYAVTPSLPVDVVGVYVLLPPPSL